MSPLNLPSLKSILLELKYIPGSMLIVLSMMLMFPFSFMKMTFIKAGRWKFTLPLIAICILLNTVFGFKVVLCMLFVLAICVPFSILFFLVHCVSHRPKE